MHRCTATIVRLLIAIAMGLGLATAVPARDCGARLTMRRCECCKNPASTSCCAAPEDRTPVQQPAAPSPLQGQPAAILHRTASAVLPPVVQVVFPVEGIAHRAVAAGHSFQSVNCVRMV